MQRIYIVEGAGDGEVGGAGPVATTVLDDIELWCFPCRSLYPHRPVGEGEVDDT